MVDQERTKDEVPEESVWDYPWPGVVEQENRPVKVVFNGVVVAESARAVRVKERTQPPTYYVPRTDVSAEVLRPIADTTECPWKGTASYFDVEVGERRAAAAAWTYQDPKPEASRLAGHVAFYASKMDECYVGGERVRSQASDYYAGWITDEVKGPFKNRHEA